MRDVDLFFSLAGWSLLFAALFGVIAGIAYQLTPFYTLYFGSGVGSRIVVSGYFGALTGILMWLILGLPTSLVITVLTFTRATRYHVMPYVVATIVGLMYCMWLLRGDDPQATIRDYYFWIALAPVVLMLFATVHRVFRRGLPELVKPE